MVFGGIVYMYVDVCVCVFLFFFLGGGAWGAVLSHPI